MLEVIEKIIFRWFFKVVVLFGYHLSLRFIFHRAFLQIWEKKKLLVVRSEEYGGCSSNSFRSSINVMVVFYFFKWALLVCFDANHNIGHLVIVFPSCKTSVKMTLLDFHVATTLLVGWRKVCLLFRAFFRCESEMTNTCFIIGDIPDKKSLPDYVLI